MRWMRRLTGSAALAAVLLVGGAAGIARAQATAAPPASREQELLAVLRSESTEAEKAITCKGLAVYGSAAAVPDLAPLLANERLASWARIPLEVIPGDEAAAALRKAADSLSGRQLVGVINSLGVRRDAGASGVLERHLAGPDPEVAAAAAVALGRIGTPPAAAALAKALPGALPGALTAGGRDAVAEACILAAERRLAAGMPAEAIVLCDAVRAANVSEQRRAEATRGAILARGTAGIPLLVELLRSPSKRLFNMGLFTAREIGAGPPRDAALAEEVDVALVREVVAADPPGGGVERDVLVIGALADRNVGGAGQRVQSAMLDAAASGAKPVRLAAVRALGRIGDAAVVSRLLGIAADPDPEFAAASRGAIAALPGPAVDREITSRLATADAGVLPTLVALVGDRRIPAVADIVPLAGHSDANVRRTALESLGAVVDLANLDVLVRATVAPRDETEAAVAAKALREAAVRMADREACAAKLAAAVDAAGTRKAILLETLGDVGGTRALAAVGVAANGSDPDMQDVATRLLGKWMTPDAAPVLLDLCRSDAAGKFKTRALKGYIRIARQFVMSDADRAGMCRQALAAAPEAADKKTVIEILVRYPSPATLAVAREAVATPGIEAEAQAAVTAIEQKLEKPAG
jgi:HEAT repeat protein